MPLTGGSAATIIAGLLIAIGLFGVVVPVLPGLLLMLVGIGVWALERGDLLGWATFAVAAAILAVGAVVKYLVPGARLRAAGVPTRVLVTGGILGIIGFFVVPVVGLFLGFVLGVYLAELARVGRDRAWGSTRGALAAVGWSMLIELASGLLAAAVWIGALLVV